MLLMTITTINQLLVAGCFDKLINIWPNKTNQSESYCRTALNKTNTHNNKRRLTARQRVKTNF